MVCLVCGSRSNKQHCLHCNELFDSVSSLIEHQRLNQHYGGHFIAKHRETRTRRMPFRLRDPDWEVQIDHEAGSYGLEQLDSDSESDTEHVSENTLSDSDTTNENIDNSSNNSVLVQGTTATGTLYQLLNKRLSHVGPKNLIYLV